LGDDVVLMADLCVDEYTSHGHCGVAGAGDYLILGKPHLHRHAAETTAVRRLLG